ncbi:hypothetical protein HA402_005611 [Bradysia odoriphaga]|nr:hypothetical protein HA402_005611 [Bradysia odoriphaga]
MVQRDITTEGIPMTVVTVNGSTEKSQTRKYVLTVDIECDEMMAKGHGDADLTWKTMLYNSAIHLAILAFTVFITILSFRYGMNLFSYHPPLMVGFFVCMTEAILCFSNENILTRYLNHKERMTFHWILQIVGGCLLAIAFTVIVISKNTKGKPHFATWHGIFGLIATIGIVLAMCGGVVAKYSFGIRKIIRPVTVKVIHLMFGCVVYALMIFTVLLGVYSNWFKRHSSVTGAIVANVIIFFIVQYVLVQPIQLIYGRIKNIYLRSNLYAEPQ